MDELDSLLAPQGDELDDLLAPTTSAQAQAPVGIRSAAGEVYTGLKRGVVGELPKMVGQAAKWATEPESGVYKFGQGIVNAAEARLAKPEIQLNPEGHNAVTNALAEGAEMLAPSIAIPAVVGAGLAAAPEAAVGGALGLGISALAGAVPMGMAQAQDTMERVKEAGGDAEAARVAGWKSGAIEAGGETIGTYLGGKLLGIGGKVIKDALKAGVDEGVLKPFAKQLAKTATGEVATEMGQGYGQATVEKNAGVDVDPWQQAKETIAPTLGMTALLAPFGLAGHIKNARVDPAIEKVQADTLDKVLPEGATLDKLEGGEATVTIQTAAGTTTVTAAPEDIAKQMLAGKPLSEMAKKGVESRATRLADLEAKALGGEQFTEPERKEYQKLLAKSGTKKFEQLGDDPARPEVVRFRVADKVYEYAPPAGMSRAQIDAELAPRAKSPGSQFNWLKKNTVEVKDEVKPQATPANEPVQAVQPGPEQVVDGVSEPLTSGTAGTAAPTPVATNQTEPTDLDTLTFQHDTLVDQWESLPVGPEKTVVQEEIFKIREEMNNVANQQTEVPAVQGKTAADVGAARAVPEVRTAELTSKVEPASARPDVAAVGPDKLGSELRQGVDDVAEVATKVDKDLKYDGDNLGLPQFTYQAGPLKGVTFSAKDASEESVRTAAEKMKAQWEGKKNNAVVVNEKAGGEIQPVLPVTGETQENNTPPASAKKVSPPRGVTPAKVKKPPKAKPEKKAVEPVYRDGSGSETLQIQPYGKIVALNDTKGNLLGRFDTAEKAAIAARDMGYGWRDQTGQLPTKPSVKPAPKAKPEKKSPSLNEKPKGGGGGKLKPLPSAYAVQAKVIAEDIAAGDTSFKRVPSEAAIRAYREKNPRAKADAAMAEMAEMDEAEYQGLTAVIEDEMVAWHGTPHTVDKFSSSKIGTGEGAQAYGYGLYFAGARNVAQWYRDKLAARPYDSAKDTAFNDFVKKFPDQAEQFAEDVGLYADRNVTVQDLVNELQNVHFRAESGGEQIVSPEIVKFILANTERAKPNNGKLYQVELAPAEDEYLLWDKPLSEQSEKVQDALKNIPQDILDSVEGQGGDGAALYRHSSKNIGNKDIMRHMMKLVDEGKISAFGKGDQKASEYLHSLGIRGIKYLDGTSRNKPLKDIKAEFLKELPEDAEFSDVEEMLGTGTFTPKNEAILKALIADDWLGFDYPAQAISAALGNKLSSYDPSPALVQAIADAQDGGTYNYVVFNDEDITILSAEKQDRNQLGDPAKAEAEKVQKGIEGKTLIQAAEWLINNTPDNGHKLIAAKVRVALLRLKGAGVVFDLNITHVGDKIPASSANSRGVSTTDFSEGIKTTVRLNGADVTGKVGMSYETVLHELIHAATQAAIHVGNRRVSKGTTLAKATAEMIDVTNLIINHFNARAASGEALTEFEQRILQRNVNALNNPSEVLAWTLSNKEMQDYLETVKLSKTETLWSRFVQSVRTFFGLTAASDTALSEVLRLGEDLLNADANQITSSLDKLMGRTSVNEFAQDAQTDIRKATRVIQNMPAFKKWFGDSKVVDSDGKPLVVYHGSPAYGFSAFDKDTINKNDPDAPYNGFWFVSSRRQAQMAGDHPWGRPDTTGEVREFYLAIKNPVTKTEAYRIARETGKYQTELREELIARGYDGVIHEVAVTVTKDMRRRIDTGEKVLVGENKYLKKDKFGGVDFYIKNELQTGYDSVDDFERISGYGTYVAFEPTQIKSIFNQTWDPANPAIDMQVQTPLGVIADEQINVFTKANEAMAATKDYLDNAHLALRNPKSKMHEYWKQHADKAFAITPLSHLAQTYGKNIKWIKQLSKHTNELEATTTRFIDDFFAIHEDAVEAVSKEKGLEGLNKAMLTATFNQMDPTKGLEDQDWLPKNVPPGGRKAAAQKAWRAAGMQKATNLTFVEAYAESVKAYKALGPKTQEQMVKMADYLVMLRDLDRDSSMAFIMKASKEGSDLRKQLMQQFDASFSTIKGMYFPLSRYGKFVLEFTTPDGRRLSENFDNTRDRELAMLKGIAEGVDKDTITLRVQQEIPAGAVAIPGELLTKLRESITKQHMAGVDPTDATAVELANETIEAVLDGFNQTVLRWLPDTSALKSAIHRKSVLGASPDMLRSINGYVQNHAGKIAWATVGKKLEEDIAGFAQENIDMVKNREEGTGEIDITVRGHLLNAMRKWLSAVQKERVSKLTSIIGKWTTGYFMTSPSTFLVQMTQVPTLTLPHLAAKYRSIPKVLNALRIAGAQAFSRKYTKDAVRSDKLVNDTYKAIHRTVGHKEVSETRQVGDYWHTPAQKLAMVRKLNDYQMQLLALREAEATNLLDISAVHEAVDVSQGNQETVLGKAMHYAMMPMRFGELGSRKTAILASFALATKQGKNFFQAMEETADVIDKTIYNFSKRDKGWLMQKDLMRIPFTFQTYRIKTALRLGLLFKDSFKAFKEKGLVAGVKDAATREFVGIFMTSAALAGTLGMPFAGAAMAILSLIFDDDDEPYDVELAYTNWLRATFGETAGDIAALGLPTALGVNLSPRIGMGDIYGAQSQPAEHLHGAGLAAWYAGNLIGPAFSVAESWFRGYDEAINKGNYAKGLETAVPKVIRDVFKAYRVATDGVKTGAGKKLIPDDQIGPDEVLMIALGFNPEEISKAQGAERSLRGISTRITERRGKLIRRAAEAILEGDGDSAAMEDIRKFNLRMPRFAIGGRDIKPAVRKILRGESGTTGKRERDVATQYEVPVMME